MMGDEGTHVCDISHNLGDLESNRLALCDNALDSTSTNDVSQGGLRTLDESLAEIRDSECCAVRVRDLEVDHRVAAVRRGG